MLFASNFDWFTVPYGWPVIAFVRFYEKIPITLTKTVNQSISQSVSQSVDQSINKSINQLISQSVSQSINQSINRWDEVAHHLRAIGSCSAFEMEILIP